MELTEKGRRKKEEEGGYKKSAGEEGENSQRGERERGRKGGVAPPVLVGEDQLAILAW